MIRRLVDLVTAFCRGTTCGDLLRDHRMQFCTIGSEIKERPPAFIVRSSAAGVEADGANSGGYHDELLLARTGKDD